MFSEKQESEEGSSTSSSSKHDDSNILLRNVSGLIFIIWLLYLTCAPRIIPGFKCLVCWLLPHGLLYGDNEAINWGTFGDYFGALNCLFAGLAFAAVYVSIRQQSKSIAIQQKELKAQLDEMANSVKEAKEQNELQREYQFADEFYRRINLLKLIEKDIYFNREMGQQAVLNMTSRIYKIAECVRLGEYQKAENMIHDKGGKGIYDISVAMDTFSVWAESFTETLAWLHGHIMQIKAHNMKKSSSTEDEKAFRELDESLNNKQSNYESILISSSIWASQYLLAIYLQEDNRIKEISSLFNHDSYVFGTVAANARDEEHRILCCCLLGIINFPDTRNTLETLHTRFFDKETDEI